MNSKEDTEEFNDRAGDDLTSKSATPTKAKPVSLPNIAENQPAENKPEEQKEGGQSEYLEYYEGGAAEVWLDYDTLKRDLLAALLEEE